MQEVMRGRKTLIEGAPGIVAVHPVKKRKHRLRRKPKAQFGEVLPGDASPHDWLEGRGPKYDYVRMEGKLRVVAYLGR